MNQSIFKGHHFASLKEWKGRKKGLWLVKLPRYEVLLTPKEILEHIRMSGAIFLSKPDHVPTVK
jgi:hypothetical protein